MEYNFIHKDIDSPEIRDLFFGPLEIDDNLVQFDDLWTWADILYYTNVFSSKGEARRNLGNIKNTDSLQGWHCVTVGKKKTKIFLLGRFSIPA